MIGGGLLFAIAAIGLSYAALVIKAAKRRDNWLFGVLAMTDAAMIAWRGVAVVSGGHIVDPVVTLPCGIGTIAMAVVTIEFLAGFPRRTCLTWPIRIALWVWAAGAIALLVLVDWHGDWKNSFTEYVFFAPALVIILALGAKGLRATTSRDARTVIGMLCFRWLFGWLAYFLGPKLGMFEEALWAETTFATLVSFVIIGSAVLRTELFSIKSAAAEVVLLATMGFVVFVSGGVVVWVTLAWTSDGSNAQKALLFGATLVPVAMASVGWLLYPRLEKRVLAPLDERRQKRLDLHDEPLPADAETATDEACARIGDIATTEDVVWSEAKLFDAESLARLREGFPITNDKQLIVPALGANEDVVGAFLITGGIRDRDTLLVAHDLADRLALTIEREQAMSQLEDARRLASLGQFAAAIAHDIRTPLTSISLNLQILQRRQYLTDDDREGVDIALEELRRLDKSVAEILDFAKPVKLVTESIDVRDLVESATRNLSPVLSEKGVALECDPSVAKLSVVHGDAQRLRQVLVNLVDNAADASKPGAKVTVRTAQPDDEHVTIEVVDHGKGIGEKDLERIFEPFFTTRSDGTGLGLAICQKLVTAHGGELKVSSRLGEGSTFTVVLPAVAV